MGLAADPMSQSRSATILRSIRGATSNFSDQLEKAKGENPNEDPFLDLCGKTITAMGLIAAIDAKNKKVPSAAEDIAMSYLQRVVAPYGEAEKIDFDETRARADWNNKALSRAHRIAAYTYMHSRGLSHTLKVGGGDSIFLDAGLESACVAIGYDWLYQYLNTESNNWKKQKVEIALKKLLQWAIALDEPFFSSDRNPVQRDSNWNAVMTGGAGLLALSALGDVRAFDCKIQLQQNVAGSSIHGWNLDQLARLQVCLSKRAIKHYWKAFTPSGAYKEGPSYWFFGMEPYVLFRDALREVLGQDDLWQGFGSLEEKSASVEAMQIIQEGGFWAEDSRSPSILLFNHGDASSSTQPVAYTFLSTGARSSNAAIRDFGLRILDQQLNNEKRNPGLIAHWAGGRFDFTRVFALFLNPEGELLTRVLSPIEVATDPNHELDLVRIQTLSSQERWVVHQKGGSFTKGHNQLDSGSFTLNIGGRTWLGDLGMEHMKTGYPVDYFATQKDGLMNYTGGLKYFRKNDLSHNLVSLPDRPLSLSGKAKLIDHHIATVEDSGTPLYSATWDTSTLYAPFASKSIRKMRLADRGRNTSLDVVDQMDFTSAFESSDSVATWHILHCRGDASNGSVSLKNVGGRARKVEISRTPKGSLKEETLHLSLLSPASAQFEVISANPNDPTTRLSKSPPGPKPAQSWSKFDPMCELSAEQEECMLSALRGNGPVLGPIAAARQCRIPDWPESCNEGCKIIRVRAKGSDLEMVGPNRKRLKFVVRIKR
jgi:hypothetical protein